MSELKFKTAQGSLAEYTKVPEECLVPKPEHVKPTEAAGLGYAGLTAYQGLFKTLKLEPGQSVFINGGSTSVGMYAIQMAKAKGCTVTVTGSTKKEELLRSLGADHVRPVLCCCVAPSCARMVTDYLRFAIAIH